MCLANVRDCLRLFVTALDYARRSRLLAARATALDFTRLLATTRDSSRLLALFAIERARVRPP